LDVHTILRINFLGFCADFSVTISKRPRLEVLRRTIILDSTFDGATPAPNDYGASFLAAIASEDGPDLAQVEGAECYAAEYFKALDGYLNVFESKSSLGGDAITSVETRQYVESLKLAHDMREPLPQIVLDIQRKSLPYTRSEGNPRSLDYLFRTKKGYMGKETKFGH
jgi:hypothetical protein